MMTNITIQNVASNISQLEKQLKNKETFLKSVSYSDTSQQECKLKCNTCDIMISLFSTSKFSLSPLDKMIDTLLLLLHEVLLKKWKLMLKFTQKRNNPHIHEIHRLFPLCWTKATLLVHECSCIILDPCNLMCYCKSKE